MTHSNSPRPYCIFFLLPILLFATTLSALANGVTLDVTTKQNLPKYEASDCKYSVVKTAQGPALKLAFGHKSDWPSLRFSAERLHYSQDWSRYIALAAVVSNPTDEPVKVNIRVDSAAESNPARGRQGGAEVAPGQQVRLLMPIGERAAIIGMRGQPPIAGLNEPNDVQLVHTTVPFNSHAIKQFQLFLGKPEQDHTVLLHKIELVPAPNVAQTAFVDQFGQYNGADWPGKLHSLSEFAERRQAEQDYFRTHPPLADRNQYGGWKNGPQLKATGRFYVAKHDGKWWFVDPEGRLFWSSGITCVRFNGETIVSGREQYYEWLPEKDDPLARFYGGWKRTRHYNFFAANAFRKYGEDYSKQFYDVTMQRFQSWGINTLACWSAPEAWRCRKVPYTIPINTPGVPSFVATSHMKAGLEKKKWFPDPFDPKFQQKLDEELKSQAEFKDDPWLLGVFIHNELPWTLGSPWRAADRAPQGIALLCLQANDDTFLAKRALLKHLQDKYKSAGSLDRKWSTQFGSWDKLAKPFELTDEQRAQALPDLTELDRLIADQYFRVCKEAVRRQMPGVLYLGCRFSGMYDRHFADVAREYCDVVSFNIYADLPSERTADELAAEFDFPVVIGEFHFGALDRGMFDPGLRRTADQAERSQKYAAYIAEAGQAPWCVGAHWFQYLDQALTGRADGENYNIGFADATDDPYPEMRDAARDVHEKLYRLRAGK